MRTEQSDYNQKLLADAQSGDPVAQYHLGLCYDMSLGVQQDKAQAAHYYTLSADQRYAYAQNALGICYEIAFGVKQNHQQAVHYYTLAAAQNDACAQYNLGRIHQDSLMGVQQDDAQAAHYYTLAAHQGYAQAQEALFQHYTNTAQLGDKDAQYMLGQCYQHGEGTTQNHQQAIHYYIQAANLGHIEAQYQLGNLYDNHGAYGHAIHYYTLAASQDHIESQNALGVCFARGLGVPQNIETAIEWWERSAKLGSQEASRILNHYATFNKTAKLMQAARKNDQEAQYHLGVCFAKGRLDTQINHDAALEWFSKAAIQGHTKAQAFVKEYAKIARWIQAANEGNADAQYAVAQCYAEGTGVIRSHDTACSYLIQSALQGHDKALAMLHQDYPSEINSLSVHMRLFWNHMIVLASRIYRAIQSFVIGLFIKTEPISKIIPAAAHAKTNDVGTQEAETAVADPVVPAEDRNVKDAQDDKDKVVSNPQPAQKKQGFVYQQCLKFSAGANLNTNVTGRRAISKMPRPTPAGTKS